MKPQVINGLTYEMAQTQVQGTKYKALNKFKQFVTPSLTYEDMDSEADIAIMKAWQTWKPSESKFNTYATNYINWMLHRFLDLNHPFFKRTFKAKNNISARGESLKNLMCKKVTSNKEFNKLHGLDGKTEFTREHYDKYVNFIASSMYGDYVEISASNLKHRNDGDEDFDVFDKAEVEAPDSFEQFEMEHDSANLGKTEKVIYDMLLDGQDIGTIAKALKMSKKELMKNFAGIDLKADAVPA